MHFWSLHFWPIRILGPKNDFVPIVVPKIKKIDSNLVLTVNPLIKNLTLLTKCHVCADVANKNNNRKSYLAFFNTTSAF